MSLPVMNAPLYSLKLPLSGKKIQYRPFLVKEEKILLLAKETGEESDIIDAICQIISNCTLGAIDAREIPLTDMEYLFLNIRAKSVGEVCRPVLQLEDETGKLIEKTVEIPINTITVITHPNHTKDLQINENVVVKMKYPTFSVSEKILKLDNEIEAIFEMSIHCIDEIFMGEESWKASDLKDSDLKNFLESLTQEQFSKFIDFFNTLPKLQKTLNVTAGKKQHTIVLEGINDFFS
jgi:hypothetical protein